MDIFCVAGTVEQAEKPSYLAEAGCGCGWDYLCCSYTGSALKARNERKRKDGPQLHLPTRVEGQLS
eukprot:1114795-Pelagomonas_calceolata.AAC.2